MNWMNCKWYVANSISNMHVNWTYWTTLVDYRIKQRNAFSYFFPLSHFRENIVSSLDSKFHATQFESIQSYYLFFFFPRFFSILGFLILISLLFGFYFMKQKNENLLKQEQDRRREKTKSNRTKQNRTDCDDKNKFYGLV